MRAVIYARYSSDLQTDASIEDQTRLCRKLAEQNGWQVTKVYSDAAMSGASHLRPGYQRILEDARARAFDVVIAEGLDRISRDQEHIAAFYKQMSFQGIPVVTVAEGEISELHIGLKGTMSSLFLKDLAIKTHRGLEGRVRKGKSAGGVTYGYDVVRTLQSDGTVVTGERRINEEQAEIVRRIFREFSDGRSPRAIAQDLNHEGVPGPRSTWGPSTIYGNHKRGTGILNNELYIGRLVWNRQRFIKDPITGRRQARLNPPEEWIVEDVPDLRIIDQDLWEEVKARQEKTRKSVISKGLTHAKRGAYLFSGMLKCGDCGGGFILVGKTYYGCANTRNKGTCSNRRTIRRDVLEARVLDGLKEQLLHPDLIAEFARAYQAEFNRLAAETRKSRARAERELVQVKRKIDQIINAITEGMFHPSMKDKMTALENRKAALEAEIESSDDENPVLLHPGLTCMYREKVARLAEALNDPGTSTRAAEVIRSLLFEIRLIPQGETLVIELVGELAGLLALQEAGKAKTRGGASGSSMEMVAGVGFEPTTFRL